MNRAQRRAAAKAGRAEHLDCGCHARVLEPVEVPACPDCGQVSPFLAAGMLSMPTSAPPGSLKTVEVGCSCGAEYPVTMAVH